ncbi:unnamed protein product [Orchesella dallaii]|uniref:Uncharacterized protein n=1 Tax=Orchesella dallaii TaxID=48710 RepID=A0ABP1QJN2_9HEXA
MFVITLTYYAGTPLILFKSGQISSQWYKIVNIILNSLTWIWSCEFQRKVQAALRLWLREHKGGKLGSLALTQIDICKMNLLAMEIEHDPETAENCADVPAKLPAEGVGKDALKEIEETWERIRDKCITSFDSGKKQMLKVAHKMTPDDQSKVAQFMKKLESVFSSLWDYICLVGKLIWQGIVSVYKKAKNFFFHIAELIQSIIYSC